MRLSTTKPNHCRKPVPTPNKQRPTKFWSDHYTESCSKITRQEIKLQEAIYELSTGEEDLVQDLSLIRKTYAESLVRFRILQQPEADLIFAKLYPIIPLHNSFSRALLGGLGDPQSDPRSVFKRSRQDEKSLKNHWFLWYFQQLGTPWEPLEVHGGPWVVLRGALEPVRRPKQRTSAPSTNGNLLSTAGNAPFTAATPKPPLRRPRMPWRPPADPLVPPLG